MKTTHEALAATIVLFCALALVVITLLPFMLVLLTIDQSKWETETIQRDGKEIGIVHYQRGVPAYEVNLAISEIMFGDTCTELMVYNFPLEPKCLHWGEDIELFDSTLMYEPLKPTKGDSSGNAAYSH